MFYRSDKSREFSLNIVGSSKFGRYPKVDEEKTYNMFISDNFLIPYAGYNIAILASVFNNGVTGRGCFTSTKFNGIITVIGANVYLCKINYSQSLQKVISAQVSFLGALQTTTGVVYITENNKPQIAISDGSAIYIYDPALAAPNFRQAIGLNFTPGYITFHDTYFICAASNDTTFGSPVNNTWRLSLNNEGYSPDGSATAWPHVNTNGTSYVGLLQTKPDNTKAVVRFPSKGNMIFVMGSIVTEAWFDTGAQLFPYQRTNQFNIDYGCLSPATVAYMDEMVVWLAQNEKSGPIIVYSNGGMPKPISTDGFDYVFAQLQKPEDSQAFLFRQDGHLFYHINFYSDNLSLYYDFNTNKIYHACDQNNNYFIAAQVAYINNQYYFVSKNTGNLYSFDTVFYTYQDTNRFGTIENHTIPRMRICSNIRTPDQAYEIINDLGFTIETGETDYVQQSLGEIIFLTQNGNTLVTQPGFLGLTTQNGNFLISQAGALVVTQQNNSGTSATLIANQTGNTGTSNLSLPRVDLSISIDGGATFGNEWPMYLPAIGLRKNKLMWWQLGIANDFVPKFRFWSNGRIVATDGIVNTRV